MNSVSLRRRRTHPLLTRAVIGISLLIMCPEARAQHACSGTASAEIRMTAGLLPTAIG